MAGSAVREKRCWCAYCLSRYDCSYSSLLSVLEMLAKGVQDVEEFQERLQQELSGLEVRTLAQYAMLANC